MKYITAATGFPGAAVLLIEIRVAKRGFSKIGLEKCTKGILICEYGGG